jgi:hypothetical protein
MRSTYILSQLIEKPVSEGLLRHSLCSLRCATSAQSSPVAPCRSEPGGHGVLMGTASARPRIFESLPPSPSKTFHSHPHFSITNTRAIMSSRKRTRGAAEDSEEEELVSLPEDDESEEE